MLNNLSFQIAQCSVFDKQGTLLIVLEMFSSQFLLSSF